MSAHPQLPARTEPDDITNLVIAALVPTHTHATASTAITPLPMVDLRKISSDNAFQYTIARVDSSGRVKDSEILDALDWHAGAYLDISATPDVLVVRSTTNGMLRIPRNRSVLIPAAARHRCGIRGGDKVLLAAAPLHDLLLVHGIHALDRMMMQYHATPAASE